MLPSPHLFRASARSLTTVFTFMVVIVVMTILISPALSIPSQEFYSENGDFYDVWDVARTRPFGVDGYFQRVSKTRFRPVIVFESLGVHSDIAYELGAEFAERYPDPYQRAEAIFSFVRDHVQYTSDIDQFGRDEYALNADELASTIREKGIAYGDCEDMAILLAVMYRGAGYRSAVVEAPGHAATLVHLPGYKKANVDWTFQGESGWIWAEATGRNNPLGWSPDRLIGEDKRFYEITDEPADVRLLPESRSVFVEGKRGDGSLFGAFPIIIMLMFILSASLRRYRR